MKQARCLFLLAGLALIGCITGDRPVMDAKAYSNGTIRQYRGGIAHTGNYIPEKSVRRNMQLIWRYDGLNVGIHTASKSSPVVDDKMVFVGSDSGYLYALNKINGMVEWRFRVRQCRNGIHGTPAIDREKVYIGAYDGYLYALKKETGRLAWETKLGDYIGASPTIFEDRIYIGVETAQPGGYLIAVNRKNGQVLFKSRELGNHTHCTPTIDKTLRKVYLGANSKIFFAFNADTGRLHWKFPTGGAIKSTAALSRQYVFFTSWDKFVYALEKNKDTLLWKFKTYKRNMSSPAVDEDANRVYVGGHDRICYALAMDSGREIWRYVTRGRIMSSPVLARLDGGGKTVLFGAADGGLYQLEAEDGRLVNHYQLDDKITSVPLVEDGTVYVSSNRDFYVFR